MNATLPTPDSVRDGHRALLDTFAEFTAALDAGDGVLPHPAMLTGSVAFLRESLLPFAHLEESALAGCPETREDTEFEHAFLAMETDRLAAAVDRLLAAGERAEPREARLADVRRVLHRIGAVLELHVLKAEEREQAFSSPSPSDPGDGFSDPGSPAPDVAEPSRGGDSVRTMLSDETSAWLRAGEWGVLSTMGPDGPHSVPISYGWDGRRIFFASAPGTKTRHIEQIPAVSLSVLQVADGAHWRSVLVRGDATRVESARGRLRAIAVLARQRLRGSPLTPVDLARLRSAMLYEIEPQAITGRARGQVEQGFRSPAPVAARR